MNINTKDYWDRRFESGDWEYRSGRLQTQTFAREQCRRMRLPRDFDGVLTDFGCGLGDAIPVYREYFPKASIRAYDLSSSAIARCREKFGALAEFRQGVATDVEPSDVIISSNVFEHLSNDLEVARVLLKVCTCLFIVVPYKEVLTPGSEHINSYDETYFAGLAPYRCVIYGSRAWGPQGRSLYWGIYLKNLVRPFVGKRKLSRPKQIMFKLSNNRPLAQDDRKTDASAVKS